MVTTPPVEIRPAKSPEDLNAVRQLFQEYAAWLGEHVCTRDMEAEIAALPGAYSPPGGCLLLANKPGEPAGCVALRPLGGGAVEMKRLYARPEFRGRGLGGARALAANAPTACPPLHAPQTRYDADDGGGNRSLSLSRFPRGRSLQRPGDRGDPLHGASPRALSRHRRAANLPGGATSSASVRRPPCRLPCPH